MARVSREEYLDAAEALFAERGFYGVSIAAIAEQLGLTKQALLHHFKSKAQLYGDVLHRISTQYDSFTVTSDLNETEAETTLRIFFDRLYDAARTQPAQTRLLMRELLDNNQRAQSAGKWYMTSFLKNLTAMIQALPNWRDASDARALAAGYQILGAINYYAVSEPTLNGIFGAAPFQRLDAAYPAQLNAMINAVIEMPPNDISK